MQETDLGLLINAAQASGDIALKFFQSNAKVWEKEDGTGPVTEADLAVNSYLEETLRSERPEYGWLSEESQDGPARQSKESVFIIDPIDGTRSFIDGAKTWAHSLAIARGGEITAAVVFLPVQNLIFTASLGGGARLNDAPICASSRSDVSGAQVLATRPTMDTKHWKAPSAPNFKRHHRPSLAYRLSLVAQGRFDAMLTLRASWEWDIAAGALIISEAGGHISDKTGSALTFNRMDPRLNGVVAAGPGLHSELLSHLATA